jgi:uncharacterized protein YceH (UPF0502 family)
MLICNPKGCPGCYKAAICNFKSGRLPIMSINNANINNADKVAINREYLRTMKDIEYVAKGESVEPVVAALTIGFSQLHTDMVQLTNIIAKKE